MEDQILEQEESQPVIEWNYAGFWIRFLAYFIDSILMGIVNIVILYAVVGIDTLADPEEGALMSNALTILIPLLYFTLMQSSSKQATLGKMAVGIKVVNADGETISFLQAIGRYLSKIPSALILLGGFIWAGFDSKKQALHDKMAGTYVLYES
jgi:uncharacterized RDD family membrane protein YckC